MLRRLLISLAWRAAQNPEIQRQAKKMTSKAVEKARPSLLKGARRAGELSKAASEEIQYQVRKTTKKK